MKITGKAIGTASLILIAFFLLLNGMAPERFAALRASLNLPSDASGPANSGQAQPASTPTNPQTETAPKVQPAASPHQMETPAAKLSS
jgi:hypothetical protein